MLLQVPKPTRVLGLGGAKNTVTLLASGVKHVLAITAEGQVGRPHAIHASRIYRMQPMHLIYTERRWP